jgi:hypothetical protein
MYILDDDAREINSVIKEEMRTCTQYCCMVLDVVLFSMYMYVF